MKISRLLLSASLGVTPTIRQAYANITEQRMGKENIVEQWYGISKEIVSLAEKLPRAHKFTLGDRLVGKTLDIYD